MHFDPNYVPDDIEKERFNFRLSPKSIRDRQLAYWISMDQAPDSTINLSEVVKALLYSWYRLRWLSGQLPTPEIVQSPVTMSVEEGQRPALPANSAHNDEPQYSDKTLEIVDTFDFDSFADDY